MRKAKILMNDRKAGQLKETAEGYEFAYDSTYLKSDKSEPISLTIPLTDKPIKSRTMLPFFDGLIPEGWLLELAEKNRKLNPRDRMGLLLACCKDCVGAVSVIEDNND